LHLERLETRFVCTMSAASSLFLSLNLSTSTSVLAPPPPTPPRFPSPSKQHAFQKTYGNPSELWTAVEAGNKEKEWYGEAVAYWDRQEASYDGVLGGHGHVSGADIRESRAFLRAALGPERFDAAEAACGSGSSGADPAHVLTAADCGAGVGRVSEELLLRVCSVVDLVEPSETMIEGARRRLLLSGADAKRTWKGEPGQFLRVGLQGFEPAEGRYDVIWVQWAMLYLTDGEKKKTGWFSLSRAPSRALSLALVLPRSRPPSSPFSLSLPLPSSIHDDVTSPTPPRPTTSPSQTTPSPSSRGPTRP